MLLDENNSIRDEIPSVFQILLGPTLKKVNYILLSMIIQVFIWINTFTKLQGVYKKRQLSVNTGIILQNIFKQFSWDQLMIN